MMWLLENAAGKGGLPVVRLSSTVNNAAAVIYLFGATLTSWTNKDGIENIFVSSLAKFDGCKAIRGGTDFSILNSEVNVLSSKLMTHPLMECRYSCCISSIWTTEDGYASTWIC